MLTLKLSKSLNASVTDMDPVKGLLNGYLSHWQSKDSDGDYTVKGKTFTKTLAESGPAGKKRIKHILNHNFDRPVGVFQELGEDNTGLKYASQLIKNRNGVFIPDADLVIAGYDSGYNFEHSYGYKTIKEEKTSQGNQLNEVWLWEGSTLTSFGANSNTPVIGLKCESDEDAIELFKSLEKFLHRGNWQDTTYQIFQSKYDELGLQLKSGRLDTIDFKSLTPEEKKRKSFLMDMIPHHQMAIEMASKVLDDDKLDTIAKKIISNQSSEITQMKTWLKEWFNAAADGMKSTQPEIITTVPEDYSEFLDRMKSQFNLNN